MTIEQLKERIEHIARIAGDDESAHGAEDDLRQEILEAIANGAENAVELARLVLTTSDIDFARWCA